MFYCLKIKSKELFKCRIHQIYNSLQHNIKQLGYKIRIQFNNTAFIIEQGKYETKIVNAYIVYNLKYQLIDQLNKFAFKNCFFGDAGKV